jgi:hypothetical protein
MRTWRMLGVVIFVSLGILRPALGDGGTHERGQARGWRGAWKDEFRDGPCQVKRAAKRREFTREITCENGVGARGHGAWKQAFWDGPCQVQIEATRDAYTEEVTCDRDH